MNVEKAPFFVTKLRVQVLPCLCYFKNGMNTGRSVRFCLAHDLICFHLWMRM